MIAYQWQTKYNYIDATYLQAGYITETLEDLRLYASDVVVFIRSRYFLLGSHSCHYPLFFNWLSPVTHSFLLTSCVVIFVVFQSGVVLFLLPPYASSSSSSCILTLRCKSILPVVPQLVSYYQTFFLSDIFLYLLQFSGRSSLCRLGMLRCLLPPADVECCFVLSTPPFVLKNHVLSPAA